MEYTKDQLLSILTDHMADEHYKCDLKSDECSIDESNYHPIIIEAQEIEGRQDNE
jgi:hypothetical protein